MKIILQSILATLARAIVKKYKPKVVGITGSVGKTSAKEAVFAVLSVKFHVRQNLKNYNNELGVPLTIIGSESAGRNLAQWIFVFVKAIKLILIKDKEYPEVLVLEMGADKPGDISYLVNVVKCDVAVVTKVGPTHLEFFGSVENVAKEKQEIVASLKREGTAVLNYDDPLVRKMEKKTKGRVIFFGQTEAAQVYSIDLSGQEFDLSGLKFKINYGGSAVPVFMPGVIGRHQINTGLIGAAVGISFGMNLIDCVAGLKNYHNPKGRMSVISGIKNSLIIDDSYNSSPVSARAAVEAVASFPFVPVRRKVAVLGDMLELGYTSEAEHFELGKIVAKNKFDLLVCVGQYKDALEQGAHENGLQNVLKYDNSVQAAEALKSLVQENDLILVKGSQGARMERVVKAIMLSPEKTGELLVRQGEEWK